MLIGRSGIIKVSICCSVFFLFHRSSCDVPTAHRGPMLRNWTEMLVAFFGAATPLLATDGTIIVTLFEGEPYTLWNIRDLARHSGLEVQRSFRFQADAYPGYSHARTLGNIEGGGGWKGEDRAARTYVLQVKSSQGGDARGSGTKRKRGGDASSSDEED